MYTVPRLDAKSVPGWAIDADPENDPTYPIKTRTPVDHEGYTWQRPTQQKAHAEILHSNERPNLSAVFGTTVPPSGLSGMLRRFAFRYSESAYRHWLPLMLADRINMIEGILHDLSHGRFPKFWSELGWPAEWKYNRKALLLRVLIELLVIIAIVGLLALWIRHE